MDCLILNDEKYHKLKKLVIGRYEYLLLIKDNNLFYVIEEDGTYRLPNPDLTLKGNVNAPLSNLNSRIIMEHIKNVIEKDIQVGLISDTESLMDVLAKIQDILDSNEILSLIKGNINELYHFDDEVKKLKDTFDELHNEKTGLVPNKVINKKPKKLKLDDAANIDGVMIAMIVNIGILLFLILMLNILK